MSVSHSVSQTPDSRIQLARATLFQGRGRTPRHIDGALHALIDLATSESDEAGSAKNLLHRARNQGMIGGGALKRYLRVVCVQPDQSMQNLKADARRAKQERHKKNKKMRAEMNASHKKGPSEDKCLQGKRKKH